MDPTPKKYNYLVSFDIGIKNLAFYIEKYNPEILKNINKIPKKCILDSNGNHTKEYSKNIRKLYRSGKSIYFNKFDMGDSTLNKGKISQEIFCNTTKMLDSHKKYFDKCSAVIIEQQMSFGKKINLRCIKMAQHIYSYFIHTFLDLKIIFEFSAFHKTKILADLGKKLNDKQRKKWATEEAERLLLLRNDFISIQGIHKHKKRDDISDCILQAQAWKYLVYVEHAKLV